MNVQTILIIVAIIAVLILIFLYTKYWKHNIYGGNFKKHFDGDDKKDA